MPFTCDSQSSLEGSLERGFVVTLDERIERHVTPSAHRIVATLMAETAPAGGVDGAGRVDGLDRVETRSGVRVDGADGASGAGVDWVAGRAEGHAGAAESDAAAEEAECAASAASFHAMMAADLAWFEGGQRVKGMAEDHQLEALARLHATALAELEARHAQAWVDRTPLSAREAVVTDVAAATGLSQADLSVRLELATGPVRRTSFLREQIRSGATTVHRACEIVRQTRHLDDDAADHIARTALAPTRDGAGLSGSLFRQRLRRALLVADTDHAARRRAARAQNRAWAEIHDDGTGRLSITNDADKIAAAYDRADAAARAARAEGDPRTLDQLRADYLTGAAITGWPRNDGATDTQTCAGAACPHTGAACIHTDTGAACTASATESDPTSAQHHGHRDDTSLGAPPTGSITTGTTTIGRTTTRADRTGHGFAGMSPSPAGKAIVVIPFETVLGNDDRPCELAGHGHVSAAQAREIITARGSIWQTLLADERTGRAIAVSPGYRPTAEMVDHVRAVDGTCRGPGCTVPARTCDLDHDTPWPHGPTHPDNLTANHRQHHRLKTAGWWSATRDADTLTWQTAAARTYTTHPKDWLDGHHASEAPIPPHSATPDPAAPDPAASDPATSDFAAPDLRASRARPAATPASDARDRAPQPGPTGTAFTRPTPDPPPF
jgi:hypothetical protein